MKRLFIAIKIEAEEPLLTMIDNLKCKLKDDRISWTALNNLHLTLLFLGDTDEQVIKNISSSLGDVCAGYKSFDIRVMGAGVFRNFENPKILWTGTQHSDVLDSLAAAVMKAVKKLNIKTDDKPFNPHITLGRIRSFSKPEAMKKLLSPYRETVFQTVTVREVILFESILHPAGPEYKPVEKFIL